MDNEIEKLRIIQYLIEEESKVTKDISKEKKEKKERKI